MGHARLLTSIDLPIIDTFHDKVIASLEKKYFFLKYTEDERKIFDQEDAMLNLGWFEDDQLCASLGFIKNREHMCGLADTILDNSPERKLAMLVHVGALSDIRKKGLVSKLTSLGLDVLRQEKFDAIIGAALGENVESGKYLKRNGFSIVGSYSHNRPDGIERTRNVWELTL